MSLVGCGKEEVANKCVKDADCSYMDCALCTNGQCVAKTKENCCKNAKCEQGENECTCKQDCGECSSKVAYMKKECNTTTKQCVSSINTASLTKSTQTYKVTVGNSQLSFTPSFDNPFILGYSKLNINLKADKLESKTNIIITRIKVYDNTNNMRVTLAEKDINQRLYTTSSEIDEQFILDVQRNNTNINQVYTQSKNLLAEVFYDKVFVDAAGKTNTQSASFENAILSNSPFIVLSNSTCKQEDCNDANDCTRDFCKKVNGYEYCENEYVAQTCCGNKVCDFSETKCTCPFDCGNCNYDYSTYITYQCDSSMKCSPKVKETSKKSNSKIFTGNSNNMFTFDARVFYNEPWTVTEPIKVQFTTKSMSTTIMNPTIQSIQLMEGATNLLGEITFDAETVPSIDQTKEFLLYPSMVSMTDVEKTSSPTLILNFKYFTGQASAPIMAISKVTFTLDAVYFVKTE